MWLFFTRENVNFKSSFVMLCVVRILIQYAKEIKLIKIFARLFVRGVQEKKSIVVKINPINLKENLKQLNNVVVL